MVVGGGLTRVNKEQFIFNKFCIVFYLLFTSKTMSKKGSMLCIWGLRCGNGEEREGIYLVF